MCVCCALMRIKSAFIYLLTLRMYTVQPVSVCYFYYYFFRVQNKNVCEHNGMGAMYLSSSETLCSRIRVAKARHRPSLPPRMPTPQSRESVRAQTPHTHHNVTHDDTPPHSTAIYDNVMQAPSHAADSQTTIKTSIANRRG